MRVKGAAFVLSACSQRSLLSSLQLPTLSLDSRCLEMMGLRTRVCRSNTVPQLRHPHTGVSGPQLLLTANSMSHRPSSFLSSGAAPSSRQTSMAYSLVTGNPKALDVLIEYRLSPFHDTNHNLPGWRTFAPTVAAFSLERGV
jgi:hypothetical protein